MVSKRRPKVPRNPLNGPVIWSWLVMLAIGALAALTDAGPSVARLMLALMLLTGLISAAWIFLSWKLGCVVMVGNAGQLYHNFRKTEPIGFYITLLLYSALCLGLLAYPASQLLGSS